MLQSEVKERTSVSFQASTFHISTVLSPEAVARYRPSGDQASASFAISVADEPWRMRRTCFTVPVVAFQMITELKLVWPAISVPSADQRMASTNPTVTNGGVV